MDLSHLPEHDGRNCVLRAVLNAAHFLDVPCDRDALQRVYDKHLEEHGVDKEHVMSVIQAGLPGVDMAVIVYKGTPLVFDDGPVWYCEVGDEIEWKRVDGSIAILLTDERYVEHAVYVTDGIPPAHMPRKMLILLHKRESDEDSKE